jgi:threonine dehydrogenase-like Zn-dependent dehydrogenase
MVEKKQIACILSAEFSPRPGYTPNERELTTRKAINGSRVWKHPTVQLNETPIPKPGHGRVLIGLKAVGICGSDIHMVESDSSGWMLYPGLTKLPVVPGHELSGQVVEVGPGVEGIRPGDMVVVEEMQWCGMCYACRTSYYNQCEHLEEVGFTINGGMEEYMVTDTKFVWKINGFLDVFGSEERAFEVGSLVEPICVSYNAIFVRADNYRPGWNVVVWGAGPIGLGAVALLKAAGAARIIVMEPVERRREIAKQLGATHTFDPIELKKKGTKPFEKVLEVTDGLGANLHVEATGVPAEVLPEIEKSLAIGGSVVWIGRADQEAPIWLERFQTRAAQLFGSQGHAGNAVFPSVIRMMESGVLDPTPIITTRYRLVDVLDAFEHAKGRKEVKVLVKP